MAVAELSPHRTSPRSRTTPRARWPSAEVCCSGRGAARQQISLSSQSLGRSERCTLARRSRASHANQRSVRCRNCADPSDRAAWNCQTATGSPPQLMAGDRAKPQPGTHATLLYVKSCEYGFGIRQPPRHQSQETRHCRHVSRTQRRNRTRQFIRQNSVLKPDLRSAIDVRQITALKP